MFRVMLLCYTMGLLHQKKDGTECHKHRHFMSLFPLYPTSRVLHTLVTEKAGLVCDAECSEDGCWGPGPDQCLSCAHFRLGNRCLLDCDSVSGYVALMTLSCIRGINILIPVLNVMLFFCLLCYQRQMKGNLILHII